MALLSEHISNAAAALQKQNYNPDDLDRMADVLGGVLRIAEASNQVMRHHVALARDEIDPHTPDDDAWDDHDSTCGFLLNWLHRPHRKIRKQLYEDDQFKLVWRALVAAAPEPAFTKKEFKKLRKQVKDPDEVLILPDGPVVGTGKYEELDPGWLWIFINYIHTKLFKDEVRCIGSSDANPVGLTPNGDGTVRIALIGDWGTGPYDMAGTNPAVDVMKTVGELKPPVDYIIHLGDTYYCGTGHHRLPRQEEQNNLLAAWKQYAPQLDKGHAFTLNSNHEMYDGAKGLFDVALADELFDAQKSRSFFALTFGDWVIVGLDSAYYDPSSLYMKGGLGNPKATDPRKKDPQYEFLANVAALGQKRTIFLSHHTACSTNGKCSMPMLTDAVSKDLKPDYWYFGHEHLGIVYGPKSIPGQQGIKARCVGHSAIPYGAPNDLPLPGDEIVEWYGHTPLNSGDAPGSATEDISLPKWSYRAKNGFAVVTLHQDTLDEAIYDEGNQKPVWTPKKKPPNN